MIPQFDRSDSFYYQFNRKRFELLGIVPLGTYCYVCGAISNCEYNNQKVCKECYDSLMDANKNSYVYCNERYYCIQDDNWAKENFLTSDCEDYNWIYSLKKITFQTEHPEKALLAAFSKYNRKITGLHFLKCIQCNIMAYKNSTEICDKCIQPAMIYFFELEPSHLFYLKEIYPHEKFVRYVFLLYFEIKLRGCK